ncbi:unnamed protein product [Parascedosporium putredinis]|uniref:Uncharacterized protein n=1 Tax=Parascedosporium putredinis TaxID=1442378 RepID=A0A9P1H038_9PEZI|nr:unnamed protein product [Parascedosporium putredinis]CAI7991721.1 unnamed protein product [Parascedosporium putredinis]
MLAARVKVCGIGAPTGRFQFSMMQPRARPPRQDHEAALEQARDSAWERPKVGKGDALNRLRPALHPDDVVASSTGNPSEDIHPSAWAKRWGLHLEGPPGRSRTTPTREDFAFSAADDPEGAAPVTKKWLMEYFDGVALDYKLDVSDWIEDILPSLHLSNDDRAYLEWLDKLREDEAWQSLLLLVDTDVFTMRAVNIADPIDGPIHPILERSKWPLNPGELDVQSFVRQHNDDLWAAMQPALRLVSKVLYQNPAFLSAAVRVWDRKIVQPFRDKRPPSTSDFLRTAYYDDLVDVMWEFVEDSVQWCVQGDPGSWAITATHVWPPPNHGRVNQFVLINADVLMPLLEPTYSESEKLAASFVLATTMLHELGHAFSSSGETLLCSPKAVLGSLYRADHKQFFKDAYAIFKHNLTEPYFESEQVAEVGFAFENWLFGGAATSLLSNMSRELPEDYWYNTSACRMERWPSPAHEENKFGAPVLGWPPSHPDPYQLCLPIHTFEKLFSKEFWDVVIPSHGLGALRIQATNYPHKLTTQLLENRWTHFVACYKSLPAIEREIEDAIEFLSEANFPIAVNYIICLLGEKSRLNIAMSRWKKFREVFDIRMMQLEEKLFALKCVLIEVNTYYRAQNLTDPALSQFVQYMLQEWLLMVMTLPGMKAPTGSEHVKSDDATRDRETMANTYSEEMKDSLGQILQQVREFIMLVVPVMNYDTSLRFWNAELVACSERIGTLLDYVTTDQTQLNPSGWRAALKTLGRGKATRRTPSRLWARHVTDSLKRMTTQQIARFDRAVTLINGVTPVPLYKQVRPLNEMGQTLADPAPGPVQFPNMLMSAERRQQLRTADMMVGLGQLGVAHGNPAAAVSAIPIIQTASAEQERLALLIVAKEAELQDLHTRRRVTDPAYKAQMELTEAEAKCQQLATELMDLRARQAHVHLGGGKVVSTQDIDLADALLADQVEQVRRCENEVAFLQGMNIVSAEELEHNKLVQELTALREAHRKENGLAQRAIRQHMNLYPSIKKDEDAMSDGSNDDTLTARLRRPTGSLHLPEPQAGAPRPFATHDRFANQFEAFRRGAIETSQRSRAETRTKI